MNSSISCLYLVYPGDLKRFTLTIVRKFS